jgi:hypothetical protein
MSEALVTINPNPNAAMVMAPVGFENMGAIKVASMMLCQLQTRVEGAQAGQFRDGLTGEHFAQIRVVPLAVAKGRVLFPPGNNFDAEPICRSSDGVTPDSRIQNPVSQACKGCSKSSWTNYNRALRTGAPECKEKWRMLFIDRDQGLPYFISIGGMSIKPLREILQGIQRKALAAAQKKQQLATKLKLATDDAVKATIQADMAMLADSIFDYGFTMKPVRVSGSNGVYYVISITEPVYLSVDVREELGPLYKQMYNDLVLQRRAESVQEETEAAVEAEFEQA